METKDTSFCEESFIDRPFLVLEILREGTLCKKIIIGLPPVKKIRYTLVGELNASIENEITIFLASFSNVAFFNITTWITC